VTVNAREASDEASLVAATQPRPMRPPLWTWVDAMDAAGHAGAPTVETAVLQESEQLRWFVVLALDDLQLRIVGGGAALDVGAESLDPVL
jgi:hypothetical protein